MLPTRNTAAWTLFGLLIAAVAVRFWAIAWGWPCGLYGDEALYMPNAIRMAADRTINTHSFHNSHLLTNICIAEIGVIRCLGQMAGYFDTATDFGKVVWAHSMLFLTSGRMIVAIFGAATVWICHRIGNLVGGNRCAFVSAAVMAFCPLHVYYSKICVNDVVMVFFVALTLLFVLQHLESMANWHWMSAGVLTGVSAGAKYNGAMVIVAPLISLFLFHALRREFGSCARKALVALPALAGGALLGFVLTNPAVVANWSEFLAGFERQRALGQLPWSTQSAAPVSLLMAKSLACGLGYAPSAFALAGALVGLRERQRSMAILLGFAVCYVGYMLTQKLFFPRFLLPVYPVLAVAAGLGAARFASFASANGIAIRSAPCRGIILLIALSPPCFEPAVRCIHMNYLLRAGETRISLAKWLNHSVRPGVSIVADFDAVAGLESANSHQQFELWSAQSPAILRRWSVAALREEKVDYVILSAAWYNMYRWDPVRRSQYREFLAQVAEGAELVKVFSPYRMDVDALPEVTDILSDATSRNCAGPKIWVYKFRSDSTE